MAVVDKSKKRKSFDGTDPSSKRVKGAASALPSPKTSLTKSLSDQSVRTKKPRKRAAEFFDDPGASNDDFVMSKALPDPESDDDKKANPKAGKKASPKAEKLAEPKVTKVTAPKVAKKEEPVVEKTAAPKKSAIKASKKTESKQAEPTKLKPALVTDKSPKKVEATEPKTLKKKLSVKFKAPIIEGSAASSKSAAAAKPVEKPIETQVAPKVPAATEKKPAPKVQPAEESAKKPKQKTKASKAKAEPVKVTKEPTPEPAEESFIEIKVAADVEMKEDNDEIVADDILAGFSSSDEEEEDETAIAIKDIPQAPVPKGLSKATKNSTSSETPGTVCVSSIPHGFFEPQMKAYFSQFGDIKRLRLSRNRKTGHSKHFAFIEFESAEVADIVAKTMNNYLLFNHRLKVQVKAPETIHEDLWKGAGRRFKKVPRALIQKRKIDAGFTHEQWNHLIKQERRRRHKKSALAQTLGYTFEGLSLKSVDNVTARQVLPAPVSDKAKTAGSKVKAQVKTLKTIPTV